MTSVTGPVQIIVLAFGEANFHGEILPELERLNDEGIVRLVDLLLVAKTKDGDLERVRASDLSAADAERWGAVVSALVGLDEDEETAAGTEHSLDEDVWYVGDAIPAGSAAAIVLLEHRWAIPLSDAITAAGGTALADAWIHRADLVAIGIAEERQAPVGA